jgi:hypothetical protein
MNSINEDALICTHTHIPGIKEFGNKIYINSGSVDKPKIGRPNITYCILNINRELRIKVEIKEIPYAFERIVKDMTKLDFPDELIDSFKSGLE